MLVDLGTGDGRFVLETAAAGPDFLVIGIDATAVAMADASRRAARAAAKGGLPNALFVVAAAESLPHELDGIADTVTIHLPWGSLLRGALAIDPPVTNGIRRLVADSGRVEILLAPATRDGPEAGVEMARRLDDGLASGWAAAGMNLVVARPATLDEIAASASTWAKRLGLRAGDPSRPAYRLELVPRTAGAGASADSAAGTAADRAPVERPATTDA